MASILIVTDDGVLAREMARALRQAGHTPVLAPDAHAALREACTGPDAIVVDLGMPDLPGLPFLQRLREVPETARCPVVVLAGGREAEQVRNAHLPRGTKVLRKPVSGSRLSRAVLAALTRSGRPPKEWLRRSWRESRRRELVRRLIAEGPDRLAVHLYRRLTLDRGRNPEPEAVDALTWPELARWARLEHLVDEAEERLLAEGLAEGHQRMVDTPPSGGAETTAGTGHALDSSSFDNSRARLAA
jgi:DNA-binding response OmpR family regulator